VVTSHDVARLAGVSQTTVSRVLNDSEKVHPATRERVMAAFEQLNYAPSAPAQAMRTRRAGSIGVVASDITNPFFPELLDALSRETHRRGLKMILWNQDDDAASQSVVEGVSRGLVDGVLVASAASGVTVVNPLKRLTVPLVFVNRGMSGFPADQVTSDNAGAARQAAEYLYSTGRRRIAAVFGPKNINTGPEREDAFLASLAEHSVTVPSAWTYRGASAFRTGYDSVLNLVDSGDLPDTLFCNSDLIAFGAINALRSRGIRIPEDMWVIGIDGLPMSGWEVFDLTTVSQPIESMAHDAVELLIGRINGSTDGPVTLHLPTTLVVRGSTDHRTP
jgi:LacI family transcriptional regulator